MYIDSDKIHTIYDQTYSNHKNSFTGSNTILTITPAFVIRIRGPSPAESQPVYSDKNLRIASGMIARDIMQTVFHTLSPGDTIAEAVKRFD